MKILLKLLNKIGIVLTIFHWILLLITLPLLIGSGIDSGGSEPTWELLAIPIIIMDLPAIIAAAVIWLPINALIETYAGFWRGLAILCIFTATIQWLFIGHLITVKINEPKSRLTTISLNDE